jgi:hypothetical protein
MITNKIILKHFCKWFNEGQFQFSHNNIKNSFKLGAVGPGHIIDHISLYITEYNNYYPKRKGIIDRYDTKELANLFVGSIK